MSLEVWGDVIFKRIWVSGVRADFYNVDWRSNIGGAANYHENASNAFVVASQLAPILSNIPGEKVIMAHSLGNMVVSSMIQDYGLEVRKYFMCNSAVPAEAYDELIADASPTNRLVHNEWIDYTNASWTALWYQRFPIGDAHNKLTWRGRFANVASVALNFYSSGDEVLELYASAHNPDWYNGFSPSGNWGERYSWHKQELWKGRKSFLGFLGTISWSGWGFKEDLFGRRVWSASDANAVTNLAVFATNTVFNPYPVSITNAAATQLETDAHLTLGIPALSPPTGRTDLSPINVTSLDMNAHRFIKNIWPRPDDGELGDRVLHSDIKNIAYFFVSPIFETLIEAGGLE